MNEPLVKADPSTGYRLAGSSRTKADGVSVALFFSGGGFRASALSYGVLKELSRAQTAGGRRLIEDVDFISAVSGGSFTAAYYCLYGERIFGEFERDFLRKDIEGILMRRAFVPVYNAPLWSADYARSDLAADVYDALLFGSATYADLLAARKRGLPSLIVNATDVKTGDSFPFVQEQFDLIGSDLSSYRVSRAVAASSAVPVLLTPIVLRNCVSSGPKGVRPWVGEPEGKVSPSDSSDPLAVFQAMVVAREQRLHDPQETPYLFLMDGGLSDNLGILNLINEVAKMGGWDAVVKPLADAGTKRLVLLVVNSESKVYSDWASQPVTPSSTEVARTLLNAGMRRRNEDILAMLRASLAQWQVQRGALAATVQVDLIEVDFNALSDPGERRYFHSIPTSLSLKAEQIDRLIEVGGRLLRENAGYRQLLLELKTKQAASVAERGHSE